MSVNKHNAKRPEPVERPKPVASVVAPQKTAPDKSKALYASLQSMVQYAETNGQRDLPHVSRAREVLDLHKPE